MSQITVSFVKDWLDKQRNAGTRVIRELEKWVQAEAGVSKSIKQEPDAGEVPVDAPRQLADSIGSGVPIKYSPELATIPPPGWSGWLE